MTPTFTLILGALLGIVAGILIGSKLQEISAARPATRRYTGPWPCPTCQSNPHAGSERQQP